MHVKPAQPGAVVRYPGHALSKERRLPDDGAEVPETGPDANYWLRLLSRGDIVRTGAPTGSEPLTPITTR